MGVMIVKSTKFKTQYLCDLRGGNVFQVGLDEEYYMVVDSDSDNNEDVMAVCLRNGSTHKVSNSQLVIFYPKARILL